MKYYEQPNYTGLGDTLDVDDDRHELFQKQYDERGFDDTELWSLDGSLIRYLYPRLIALQKIQKELHEPTKYDIKLQNVIDQFKIILEDDTFVNESNMVKQALTDFIEITNGIWY
jgi:hypothetical protein